MTVHFGKRVVGEEAHAKAVAAAEGGAEIFGKRVRGAISSDSITNQAKRASEFGPRTTSKAHLTDTTGKKGTISVEDMKVLLDEATGNIPAFIDSLYEQELALPGGPRKDALEVLLVAEMGIKGEGRRTVADEINALLGKGVDANERTAQEAADLQERYAAMDERTEENKLLVDAPRLKALREREENLAFVRKGGSKSGKGQAEDSSANSISLRTGNDTAQGNLLGGSASPQDKPQRSAGEPSKRAAKKTSTRKSAKKSE